MLPPVAVLASAPSLKVPATLLPRIGNVLFMIFRSICWTELIVRAWPVAWGMKAGLHLREGTGRA
jgi:hypothetical protein